ncbi:MAG TPA: DegV family protein [Ktedonobacterales bacterium]
MAIRIVVDSTADIPQERAQNLDIEVVPLMVLFGDESYRDGVDLDTATFYRKLVASHTSPTTSTPPPAAFEDAYRKLAADGATGILSLSLASSLSATYSVAQGAAGIVSQETGVPIEVVDSHTVSAGIGAAAEVIAREAQGGASLADLQAHAESMFSRTRVIAVLDTLEYLQRGGRIGRARALLGTMLSVKPLIGVRDGQIVPLENVRTKSKAQERIGQMVAEMGALQSLAIVQADAAAGNALETIIRRTWQGEIEHSILGPVVGTHAGPGAAGVAVILQEAGA